MAIATLANARSTSRKPGAAKNKKTHKTGKRNKSGAKRANKSTGVARATLGPAAIAKIEQNAKRTQLAELRARGVLENKRGKKKHSKKRGKKRNGIARLLPSLPNPTFRSIWSGIKTGGVGLAGGALSTITAALALALLDKVAPTWAQSRWAQPIATFVAAILVVPLVASIKILNLSSGSQEAAAWGGIIFSLGGVYNEFTGANIFSPQLGEGVVNSATNLFPSTGNAQADNAARAVLKSGGNPAQAAQVAASTMRGMRGAPRNVSPIGSVTVAF